MEFIRVRRQSETNKKSGIIKLVIVTECSLLSYGLIKALSGSEFIFMTDAMSGNEFSSELEKTGKGGILLFLIEIIFQKTTPRS